MHSGPLRARACPTHRHASPDDTFHTFHFPPCPRQQPRAHGRQSTRVNVQACHAPPLTTKVTSAPSPPASSRSMSGTKEDLVAARKVCGECSRAEMTRTWWAEGEGVSGREEGEKGWSAEGRESVWGWQGRGDYVRGLSCRVARPQRRGL